MQVKQLLKNHSGFHSFSNINVHKQYFSTIWQIHEADRDYGNCYVIIVNKYLDNLAGSESINY